MRVVVVGVRVAHDPHRLARVGAADGRLVLPAGEQLVLVAQHAAGLGRRDEAGPDPDAVGAERQRGGQAAAVEDAARGDDGDAVADGVDDLGDQGERGDLAGVPARLGALSHDEVASRLHGAHACSTLPHMLTTTRSCWWQRSTTSVGTPRPATNADAPPSMTSLTWSVMPPGMAVSRSTPNGLSVAARIAAISATIVSLPMVEAPRQPKPPAAETAAARAEYGDAAHAGQHDGVLDPEQFGEAGAHGSGPSLVVGSMRPRAASAAATVARATVSL